MSMDWQQYEKEVFEELRSRYPGASMTRDARVIGRFSQAPRQIDVLIETQVLDTPMRIVVDAKHHSRPLDVNDVESFVSMISDVGAHRGLLVSSSGYTGAAAARAHREANQDIELDVFTLDELKQFQATVALPISGKYGVALQAPFGWVVDTQLRDGAIACLYQRGYDLEAAGHAKEWMYLNFWKKDDAAPDLDGLLRLQAKTLHDGVLSYLPGVDRPNARTAIRLAEVPGYPTPEYTGFVEFDEFIFFAVLFTTPEMSKRNVRKLREILRTVKPILVRHV